MTAPTQAALRDAVVRAATAYVKALHRTINEPAEFEAFQECSTTRRALVAAVAALQEAES